MDFQSNYYLLSVLIIFGLVFYWVSFSLKEFLEYYYEERGKHKLRHLKYLDKYRDEMNKRKNF
ncbi:MAG: hypothetical protein COA79_05435 [Planctomycetota bacterium]|nr:MAG: hypothetical protein COA79_05435 [Planctomycetota bacterium]